VWRRINWATFFWILEMFKSPIRIWHPNCLPCGRSPPISCYPMRSLSATILETNLLPNELRNGLEEFSFPWIRNIFNCCECAEYLPSFCDMPIWKNARSSKSTAFFAKQCGLSLNGSEDVAETTRRSYTFSLDFFVKYLMLSEYACRNENVSDTWSSIKNSELRLSYWENMYIGLIPSASLPWMLSGTRMHVYAWHCRRPAS